MDSAAVGLPPSWNVTIQSATSLVSATGALAVTALTAR